MNQKETRSQMKVEGEATLVCVYCDDPYTEYHVTHVVPIKIIFDREREREREREERERERERCGCECPCDIERSPIMPT